MRVSREGLSVDEKTVNWLAVAVSVCALLGPPATFLTVQATQGERVTALERYRDGAESQRDRIVDKLDSIADRLARIEGKLDPH